MVYGPNFMVDLVLKGVGRTCMAGRRVRQNTGKHGKQMKKTPNFRLADQGTAGKSAT